MDFKAASVGAFAGFAQLDHTRNKTAVNIGARLWTTLCVLAEPVESLEAIAPRELVESRINVVWQRIED